MSGSYPLHYAPLYIYFVCDVIWCDWQDGVVVQHTVLGREARVRFPALSLLLFNMSFRYSERGRGSDTGFIPLR